MWVLSPPSQNVLQHHLQEAKWSFFFFSFVTLRLKSCVDWTQSEMLNICSNVKGCTVRKTREGPTTALVTWFRRDFFQPDRRRQIMNVQNCFSYLKWQEHITIPSWRHLYIYLVSIPMNTFATNPKLPVGNLTVERKFVLFFVTLFMSLPNGSNRSKEWKHAAVFQLLNSKVKKEKKTLKK